MLKKLVRHLRRNPLDFVTSDRRTIGEVIFAPLGAKVAPVVVDVGARNGMGQLPRSYTERARLIGFEPNPEEYRKLVEGKTDAAAIGAFLPEFAATEFHPVAIWDRKETRPFYITAGPGACTLMGEPIERIAASAFLDSTPTKSFFDAHTRVLKTEQMECDTLDSAVGDRVVDFLKLDVEGAEVKCLVGAKKLLDDHRVLLIYSEFQTFPYYEDHGLFGEQHSLLTSQGYRLLDLDLGHQAYRRGNWNTPRDADRRLFMAGDAIFTVDPDRVSLPPELLQRQAAIALSFGFISFALSLLEEARLNSKTEIEMIAAAGAAAWTIQRLKRSWISLPRRIGQKISY